MGAKNLVIIPFAFKQGASTGVNIREQSASYDIYIKNCCVALISARKNNDESTDCALVTNFKLPTKYSELLNRNGIKIFYQDFDYFYFGDKYKWSLAFYKLCAIYHIVRKTKYENYAYVDSDVIIQDSFDPIWAYCNDRILLLNITKSEAQMEYNNFRKEVLAFQDVKNVVHWGGEFFAANRTNSLAFTETSYSIFKELLSSQYITTHGDEFITSLTAISFADLIQDAKDFVCRIWTGTYRSVPSHFNRVVVLHLPAEKEYSMLKLYNKWINKGKTLPSGKQLYDICNISSPSLLTRIKCLIKFILQK